MDARNRNPRPQVRGNINSPWDSQLTPESHAESLTSTDHSDSSGYIAQHYLHPN